MVGIATAIFATTDHEPRKSEKRIRATIANRPSQAQALKDSELADLNQLVSFMIMFLNYYFL